MNHPLISVIVPVYNVEAYLERCVQSIVNQTYNYLEILLVDDGASDASGSLCDAWAARDSRVTVIHKGNGGQAEARNFGMTLAGGDCIGFVDSDDWAMPEMYRHLQSVMHSTAADLVGCDHYISEKEAEVFSEEKKEEISVFEFDRREAVSDILYGKHFDSTVWNLLTKREIATQVQFEVGKIHEDILWPFRAVMKCQKVAYSTKKCYVYFQRSGSTMNTVYTSRRFDGLDALQQRAQEVKEHYPELYPQAERNYAGVCMYQYQYLERQPHTAANQAFMKTLHTRFCQADLKAVIHIAEIKYKVWYVLYMVFPRFTAHIRNALKIGM